MKQETNVLNTSKLNLDAVLYTEAPGSFAETESGKLVLNATELQLPGDISFSLDKLKTAKYEKIEENHVIKVTTSSDNEIYISISGVNKLKVISYAEVISDAIQNFDPDAVQTNIIESSSLSNVGSNSNSPQSEAPTFERKHIIDTTQNDAPQNKTSQNNTPQQNKTPQNNKKEVLNIVDGIKKEVLNIVDGIKKQTLSQNNENSNLNKDDKPSTGLSILSFFIPLVGFILAAVNWKSKPISAKRYLIISGIAIVFCIFVSVISKQLASNSGGITENYPICNANISRAFTTFTDYGRPSHDVKTIKEVCERWRNGINCKFKDNKEFTTPLRNTFRVISHYP